MFRPFSPTFSDTVTERRPRTCYVVVIKHFVSRVESVELPSRRRLRMRAEETKKRSKPRARLYGLRRRLKIIRLENQKVHL